MSSKNSVDRLEHDVLRELVRRWREKSGISQRQLSARLKRPVNFMVKIENGVRGITVVDLVDIVDRLELDLASCLAEYARELKSTLDRNSPLESP